MTEPKLRERPDEYLDIRNDLLCRQSPRVSIVRSTQTVSVERLYAPSELPQSGSWEPSGVYAMP